jgi:hypothetical protein
MVYAFDSGSGIHGQINRAMCPGTFVNTGVSIKAVVPHVSKEMISRYEPKKGTIRLVNGSVIKGTPD